MEFQRIVSTIGPEFCSIIFDGTTDVAEAFCILARYLSKTDTHWEIKQDCIRLQFLEKSLAGQQIANVLVTNILDRAERKSGCVVAFAHDRASANEVAMETLSVVFPKAADIPCMSHTFDNVGKKLVCPILDEFMGLWVNLSNRSNAGRKLFYSHFKESMKRLSNVRWWSGFEQREQIFLNFSSLLPFVQECFGFGYAQASSNSMIDILRDDDKRFLLRLELAVCHDICYPLVVATHKLEGDGFLSPMAFATIETVRLHVASVRLLDQSALPDVHAIIRVQLGEATTPAAQRAVTAKWLYVKKIALPVIQYFETKFATSNGPLASAIAIFKACRIFDPKWVVTQLCDPTLVDALAIIPALGPNNNAATWPVKAAKMKAELGSYFVASQGISVDVDLVEFWRLQQKALPELTSAATLAMLIQPSSAGVERCFSLLEMFSSQQESMLEDMKEASVMLRYNNRQKT